MPKFVTRRNALFASAAAATTQVIPTSATAATSTDQAAVAAALGFWPVISDTPPASATMYGVPVVWLSSAGALAATPVIPTAPLWSDATASVSIPGNVTGVEYRDASGAIAQGTKKTYSAGASVTITAIALPGYVLNGTSTWSHVFSDPNKLTLLGSDSFAGPATATMVGRAFDNKVAGATGGVGALRWFQLGPGSQPYWGSADPGHPYSAGATGHGLDGSGGFGWMPSGAPPVMSRPTVYPTGGKLPADTYYYKVTAMAYRGETGAGFQTEQVVTTSGSTSRVALSWAPVSGARSYRIYRGTNTGLSYSLPGQLIATTTETSYVDAGTTTPGALTPWQYDNINARPLFKPGRAWKIMFDVVNYDYNRAPFVVLNFYSDGLLKQQEIGLRATSPTATTVGKLPNGAPIASSGLNGTWTAMLLPNGSFTITAPNKQESHMTFAATLANDAKLDWARLGFYGTGAGHATRIKDLRVWRVGS